MTVQITIPSPGESISEVILGPWHKHAGDWVEKDETLVEVESDKVTLEIPAPESGVLSVDAVEGTEMLVGDVIGSIDPAAVRAAAPAGAPAATVPAQSIASPAAAATAVEVATATVGARATSLAKKVAADQGVDLTGIPGTGPSGRITRDDVIAAASVPTAPVPAAPVATPVTAPVVVAAAPGARGVRREKMSRLRQRIAERLVQAQQTAAMLTTFNECDMTEVMRLRSAHKEKFADRYGVGLGFMSFFVKAATSALQAVPGVNAYIDGNEIEYHDYTDISVAVGTPKGLVVPVLRDTQLMSFADVESTIKDFALRARDGKLTLDEMTGGTFTISNGGIFGSLNSTPILNPPQSAILGMHTIKKRPVEDPNNPGAIVLRPMMYLAVSYDHRVVDGEQAVTFLAHIKECLEHPERLLLGI